jgi:hypothetical protein
MIFTVVRAVREADATAPENADKPSRLVGAAVRSIAAAAMDIPYVDEVLRLDLGDFPRTIPAALE